MGIEIQTCVFVYMCVYQCVSPWGADIVDRECVPDTVAARLQSDKTL